MSGDGERRTGRVVNWDERRGFGFVREDGGQKVDYFTHVKDCEGKLDVDDRVSFTIGPGRKKGKLAAYNVRLTQSFAATGIASGEALGLPAAKWLQP